MYYAYVLKSLSDGTLYYGSSDNPEDRLKFRHNAGRVVYTRARRPWVLVYKEEFLTRTEAMKREKFFKSGKGREYLKTIINK